MKIAALVAALVLAVGCGGVGATGPKGDPGTPGPANQITATLLCTGGLENTSLSFQYAVIPFSDGFVFASAIIRNGSTQASSSSFYSPQQNGWGTAPVTLTFDVIEPADGGWWELSTDRNTLVVTITLHDGPNKDSWRIWTIPPDKCTVNHY
jgi:hypothetical protein